MKKIIIGLILIIVLKKGIDLKYQKSIKGTVAYYGGMVKSALDSENSEIDPILFLALIQVESQGNPYALGATGDYGLTQITQPALTDYNKTHKTELQLFDMFNPIQAIKVGVWVLNRAYIHFDGALTDALRAYNGGITGASKNPTLSAQYADRVMKTYERLKTEIGGIV